MQTEITQFGNLLTSDGVLTQSGWARQLFLRYNRNHVKAHPFRIKEWDFYEIRNDKFDLFLVVYDVGYQAKIQATFIDFKDKTIKEANEILWFSKGSLNLPPTSDVGDINIKIKNSSWNSIRKPDHRIFKFNFPDFEDGKGFKGEIKLEQPKFMDTMTNVIPFNKNNQFVYAQKINCMPAYGEFQVGDRKIEISPRDSVYGCLDWTRAVFPYKTEWWWASASGKVNNHIFGLNIDYGFGAESSKNMIFFDNKGHHLDEVKYTWNSSNIEEDWIFTSKDERIDLKLHPTFIENEKTNYILLNMKVLKVYGFFTGTVVLDNGEKIQIRKEDQLFGHAEHVINHW